MGADVCLKAVRAAEHVGLELNEEQCSKLVRFHDWLAGEALRAGGIGPHEVERIWDRHIADSIVFAAGVGHDECLDVGTGVGLPGVPLAVILPDVSFRLIDRSGRRCDLAARAIRILDLANCVVAQQDIKDTADRFGSIVSRAAIPPAALAIHVKRLLLPGGVATIGLSRAGQYDHLPQNLPEGLRATVVSVPEKILDSGASLLRIEAS